MPTRSPHCRVGPPARPPPADHGCGAAQPAHQRRQQHPGERGVREERAAPGQAAWYGALAALNWKSCSRQPAPAPVLAPRPLCRCLRAAPRRLRLRLPLRALHWLVTWTPRCSSRPTCRRWRCGEHGQAVAAAGPAPLACIDARTLQPRTPCSRSAFLSRRPLATTPSACAEPPVSSSSPAMRWGAAVRLPATTRSCVRPPLPPHPSRAANVVAKTVMVHTCSGVVLALTQDSPTFKARCSCSARRVVAGWLDSARSALPAHNPGNPASILHQCCYR